VISHNVQHCKFSPSRSDSLYKLPSKPPKQGMLRRVPRVHRRKQPALCVQASLCALTRRLLHLGIYYFKTERPHCLTYLNITHRRCIGAGCTHFARCRVLSAMQGMAHQYAVRHTDTTSQLPYSHPTALKHRFETVRRHSSVLQATVLLVCSESDQQHAA
jgi:hypothetical protein